LFSAPATVSVIASLKSHSYSQICANRFGNVWGAV